MKTEISILKELKHEHVVKLEDYFEDDDLCYIVMEHC